MKINGDIKIGNTNKTLNEVANYYENYYEKGSNSNGDWIKFNNGLMICIMQKVIVVNLTEKWGNSGFYSTVVSIGKMPQSFASRPFVSINNNGVPFTTYSYNVSLDDWGNVRILYPTALSNYNINIRAFAIGFWK